MTDKQTKVIMPIVLYFLAFAIANASPLNSVELNSTKVSLTLPTLPSFDIPSRPRVSLESFLDRARMGLVEYDETNKSLKIDYFDTPFERIYFDNDIAHMVKMSAKDTKHILRPYHYHRFQLNEIKPVFRIHCKFMLNFISLGNKTWEDEYRLATNLFAYYRRLYENGDHTDLVCYFVDASTQAQANCLLRLVSDPQGEFPFPIVEYSHVHRNRHPNEPRVSHYHPHNNLYCSLMKRKLKQSFIPVKNIVTFPTLRAIPNLDFSSSNTITVITKANFGENNETSTPPTTFSGASTLSILMTTSLESVFSNLSSALSNNENLQLNTFAVNATSNTQVILSKPIFWALIVCANVGIFFVLLFLGVLYKRKVSSHASLDDNNIECQVIQDISAKNLRHDLDENFV